MHTTVNFYSVHALRKAEKLLKGLFADSSEREKQMHLEAKSPFLMQELIEEVETILQNDEIEYEIINLNS